jgi:hypothetical protein
MQQENPTLEDVLKLVERLSQEDKRRLVERVAPEVEKGKTWESIRRNRSLHGLWADLGPAPSEEEINEARKEAWKNFPREDI